MREAGAVFEPFSTRFNLVRPVLPDMDEIADDIQEILSTGMVTKGRYLRKFEEAVAAHLGVKHAVGVSSCTIGLMLTYQALGLTGNAVVPSFTFMATVSSLVWAGVRPVFADVDLGTATISPEAVEEAITPDTSAIVAVHTFGNPADIASLEGVAERHGLTLVFDAAHGFGAMFEGRPAGPQGSAQVFSLSPTKLLIAGEGGIVATNDGGLAERVRMGREYGNDGAYNSAFAGLNGRLSEFHALLGLRSLDRLEGAARRRDEIAGIYRRLLGRLPGIGFHEVRAGNRSSYKDFSLMVDAGTFGMSRDELARALAAQNVDSRAYYNPPVHRHSAYKHFAAGASLPNTDLLANTSLSIPIWSDMNDVSARAVCRSVELAQEAAAS